MPISMRQSWNGEGEVTNLIKKGGKHRFRLIFRVISFLALVGVTFIIKSYSNNDIQSASAVSFEEHNLRQTHHSSNSKSIPKGEYSESKKDLIIRNDGGSSTSVSSTSTLLTRRLESVEENCEKSTNALENKTLLILYISGVLYTFLAIAIVCDEFFVPSLEEIASERYLDLSMDVAGATLMAAGGSAPELFTSLIGTFQRSEVGFGTIVGSAVFNVLFVIGMCALFSKDLLTLTAWPLARDCAYYSLGLIVLAIFCGYSSPGKIELWEAVVQFLLYIGYVLVMKYNDKIHTCIAKKQTKVTTTETRDKEEHAPAVKTFHAGLLKLFLKHGSLVDNIGISMITKMDGDPDALFKKLDVSGDGYIDKEEFHKLFEILECRVTEEEISNALNELDINHDGKIDLKEFTEWFLKSESSLRVELKKTFDEFDVDNSGAIDTKELEKLLLCLNVEPSDENISAVINEASTRDTEEQLISYKDFEEWYMASPHWRNQKIATENTEIEEAEEESIMSNLKPPQSRNVFELFRWIVLFPIILVLCLTIPDFKKPGKSKLCFFAFIISIGWIGVFTFYMVALAEVIGATLGIPMVLMGLTFLAAGTSVPDLISSVIVARMGEGDMAVSSSIGSNIFDITVGLPFPWILYCLWHNTPNHVEIGTEGMEISILILLIMLVIIIALIHWSGWKMTKGLGIGMFFLYFFYLGQAVIRQLPLSSCSHM